MNIYIYIIKEIKKKKKEIKHKKKKKEDISNINTYLNNEPLNTTMKIETPNKKKKKMMVMMKLKM